MNYGVNKSDINSTLKELVYKGISPELKQILANDFIEIVKKMKKIKNLHFLLKTKGSKSFKI